MPRNTVTRCSPEFAKETTCMVERSAGGWGGVEGTTTETVATTGPLRTMRTGFFRASEKVTISSEPRAGTTLPRERTAFAVVEGLFARITRTGCWRGSAKRTVSVVAAPVPTKMLICAAIPRGSRDFDARGDASAAPIPAKYTTAAIMRSGLKHLMRELVQDNGFAVKPPDRPCQLNRRSASIAKPNLPFDGHLRTARCRKS